MVKLSKIITQVRGVSYKPNDVILEKKAGYTCLLRANNIDRGELKFDDVVYVDSARVKNTQLLRAEDILICASSGSRHLVGKAACVIGDMNVTFGVFCKVIRPLAEYAPFLGWFFKSPRYRMQISNASAGVNINNIRAEDIDNMEIDLLTVKQREEAVRKLNAITHLISLRQRQAEKLDELVKARFVEMFGDPVLNCQGFPVRTIGELTTEVKYGTSKPAVEGGKYPYLRMNNLTIDGKLDLHDLKQIDVDTSEFEKCVVRKGDVLFNRTNSAELVGKTAYYGLDEEMIIAGYIIRVRVNNLILPQYLSFYMNMPFMKQRIRSMAKGAVNQANINSKELKSIKVIVPPLEVQGKVVEYEERIDREKDRIQRSAALLETLKRSLMQQYFG